ncbi:hypothetical protein [Streptomyces malaysiensis]|uniref:hypothetical protein n=1 Tax=Streptomyces malaysiensis TaxID=92644 RepID=UPI002B2B84C8|nr:hypothetical protein R8789_20375 [Streptomyces malaysiensis]
MTALRILFAGVFHWNAGSSHMIAEYARVASAAGCEVGVSSQLSRLDGTVDAHLPLVALVVEHRRPRWAIGSPASRSPRRRAA